MELLSYFIEQQIKTYGKDSITDRVIYNLVVDVYPKKSIQETKRLERELTEKYINRKEC